MFRVMMITVIMMMMLDAVSEQLIASPVVLILAEASAELPLSHSASDPALAPCESWDSGC